jgi:Putative transposase/Transposase zinc-binding domain
MITLAQLLRQHQSELTDTYLTKLQAPHYAAIKAIMACHTPACGTLDYLCCPCFKEQHYYQACGHRSCPACQNHCTQQWLDRQRQKLLPLDYYMATFTLPFELRDFAWHNHAWTYQTLFTLAAETLKQFARNDKKLGVDLGMTGVLHSHARRLDYHPHVHVVIPGGGLNKQQQLWKQSSREYLFNGRALAKVFRGKFIAAMKQAGHSLPDNLPEKWIAHCKHVGKGEPALVYLARYLYRGVINESNIIDYDGHEVTFRYKDSTTQKWRTRTQTVVTFLWRVLQHVLPKGFRRVRDYGFLHANAKRTLQRIQLMLKVAIAAFNPITTKEVCCPCCGLAMNFLGFRKNKPLLDRFTTN